MWCGIAAYVAVAAHYGHQRRATVKVSSLHITIVDTADVRVATTDKVRRWLSEAGIDPIGRPVDSIDTGAIESALALQPEVKHASAWTNLDGELTVRIEPRKPAFRVRMSNGYRFWYTDDGVIIPDRGDFAAYVPVITGNIAFPFPTTAGGSYERMRTTAYNDFLERFTALDAQRRELAAKAAATRSQIRAIRQSTPKRWWSASRRKTFVEGKAARIASLQKEQTELTAELRKMAGLGAELREKEKKSYESLLFLTKLANFVEYIGTSDFWSAQIVQINIEGGSELNGSRVYGNGSWHEPQLELIPRAGDHVVLLGELDGTETRRLENLQRFYLDGLWHEGWRTYTGIDIRYRNQIVCTQ
jgi:cell division protein FtsQ